MSLHTPATDRVADALTRVGSGVAAVLFVAAAALAVPALVASAVLSAMPSMLASRDADAVTFVAVLAVIALGASLALVAVGRAMRHH